MRLRLGIAWVGAWCLAAGVAKGQAPAPVEEQPPAQEAPVPPALEPIPTPEELPKAAVIEPVYTIQQATAASSSWDARNDASEWMIAPADTLRLGLENVLVTAEGDLTPLLATPELALTDLVLLKLTGGYSIGGDVELLGSVTLVPKQPIATNALALAGGLLGARAGLADAWATSVLVGAGPTIDGSGAWVDGAWTIDARYHADRFIVFDGSAGVGATAVGVAGDMIGLTEILFGGEAILQEPNKAAITAGIAFAIPFWHGDPASWPLEPQTRVDVHAAGILSLADRWDIWLRGAVIDRGELTAPSSVLPILDGGFDQRQITLGVTYRSDQRDPDFGL